MICVENPAEYVRLMRGLLGQNKAAIPRHGAPLVLVEDSVPDDESSFLGRTMTERVFQSAIMELGNGRLEYSSRDDVSRLPTPLGKEKPNGSSGLYRDECRFVMECIYGEPVTVIDRFPVAREILKNRPAGLTFVGIISGGEGHAIAVVNADEKGIRYRDPNYPGTLFMPWSEFRSRFRFLFLPGSVVDQLKDLPGEVA
jgi:hypothetical protein